MMSTSNRMELQSAIEALKHLDGPCQVEFYTDSKYLKDGITGWLPKWVRRGWITSDKEPVKNRDLWEQLHAETTRHRIAWNWIKGHSGNRENERCNQLAYQEAAKINKQ